MYIKKCEHCGNGFETDDHRRKFCGHSCSASFSNKNRKRSKSSKQKTRMSVLKQKGIDGEYTPIIWCKCVECDKTFYNKPLLNTPNKRRKKKTCSIECYDNRMQQIGRDIGPTAGEASALKRCLRSKDEMTLYDLCHQKYNNVDHNKHLVDGWDADIILNDQKIAILWNGPWHYKEMPGLIHSLKQVQSRDRIKQKLFKKKGWNVVIFEDRDYTPESAFAEVKKIVG